jgi:hypothetical protein
MLRAFLTVAILLFAASSPASMPPHSASEMPCHNVPVPEPHTIPADLCGMAVCCIVLPVPVFIAAARPAAVAPCYADRPAGDIAGLTRTPPSPPPRPIA